MTRKTKLITLGCVLVAAIGVTVGVGLSESEKEAISESGEVVFELPADDATALSWQYDDDGSEVSLAFHKDGDWLYDEDEAFPVDGEKIDALLDVFSELSAAFVIEDVTDYDQYGLENPLCSAAPPQASVEVYSGKGYERVADFTFSYDYSAQWLEQLRQSLSVAVDRVLESVPAGDTQSRIRSACRILSNDCSYDPDVSDFGGTAYGALIIGHANSLGYAQACKLLCDRMDVPCQIIAGRYDRAEHYWNIVEIDGARYHIDVSLAAQLGLSAVFLRSDSALWGRYTWDIDAYAPCLGAATGAQ